MTIITMTREMGSLGKDVAAGVAEKLNLQVIHHEVVEREVAGKMAVEESDVHRFLEGTPKLLDRWKIDKDKLSQYTSEEVYDFAAQGNVVIRGWGASALLRRIPHVIRVRVCAPLPFRANVLQERLGLDDTKLARREIERNDAAHTRAMRALQKTDWKAPLNYDLVLNTERVPIPDCVAMVLTLASSPAFKETPQSQQVLADLVIENRIRNALAVHKELRLSGKNMDILVSGGNVVLAGAVDSTNNSGLAQSVVRRIEGVNSVTNNLIIPMSYRTDWTS